MSVRGCTREFWRDGQTILQVFMVWNLELRNDCHLDLPSKLVWCFEIYIALYGSKVYSLPILGFQGRCIRMLEDDVEMTGRSVFSEGRRISFYISSLKIDSLIARKCLGVASS